ncbi:MAG: M1 family aminopeptidase [Ferruginibacter sp.]
MKKLYSLLVLLFFYGASYAQPSTTNYDVKYYRLELRINPDTSIGKYIKGKVTTYFTTQKSNFTLLSFDFASALICDSVYYHGVKLANVKVVKQVDSLKITLPSITATNTLDSVSIWYKGVPPLTAGFSNGTGYVKSTHNSGAQNYVYTLSEPYSSFTWWPCKSFIVADKADSMDMLVSTPLNFKVAGNGSLVSETTIGSNIFTYWKERYPIAAYQVCTAVANYVQYPAIADTVVMGTTKMPVYNFIFPETNTAAAHTALDRVPLMITTFNSLFGDYPFKKEKYGNYTFGFGGGMEHNTFSGESSNNVYTNAANWDILAHELGHQWWGDNVSNASWSDIWVHESFADYSEVLCAEFAPSVSALAGVTGLSWRQGKKNTVLNPGNQARPVYVTDTSTIITIFTPAVYIYERGGMVISMLRTLLGDAKFFQALKDYQSDASLELNSAFTSNVQQHMEAASGLNLSTFFSQWIYNTGFANYSGAQWNTFGASNKTVVLQLPQTTQFSSLTHFDMPIAVRMQGSVSGDTTVIIYDKNGIMNYVNNGTLISSGSNSVQYDLSFKPTIFTFDPLSQVLANGSFTKNVGLTLLATNLLSFTGNKEGVNVKLKWAITNSFDYNFFELERSNDGVHFSKIADLKSADFPGLFNFTYTDYYALSGTSYYRLKVSEKDGSVIYSNTSVVSFEEKGTLYSITPNPATDFIMIKTKSNNRVSSVRIINAVGKEYIRIPNPVFTNNNLKISVAVLAAGNYFIEIISEDNIKQTKEIVVIK